MVRILKGKNGWSTIETLITIPLLVFILFAAVQYWGVFTIYQQAQSIKYNTLAAMEVAGGLIPAKKQVVIQELLDLGADLNTIEISGDLLEDEHPPKFWPETVNLRIEFVPIHFNNFSARMLVGGSPGEPIKIGVKGSAISALVAVQE